MDCVYSDWATVICGVPQGSVLGPLLFISYTNDLPNVLNSHVHLFANDIAMYVSDTDPTLVQDKLNSDLASLFKWVTSNGFSVNISKCHSMFLAGRHYHNQLSTIRLMLNSNFIEPQRS